MSFGPARPIHRWGTSFNQSCTLWRKCGGAPSCCQKRSWGSKSFSWGKRWFCSISRYAMHDTVFALKKNGLWNRTSQTATQKWLTHGSHHFTNVTLWRERKSLHSLKLSRFSFIIRKNHTSVHHCGTDGSMRSCPHSRPGFDPLSEQVSWVRFFQGFSSSVRQMSGKFRLTKSPNMIWLS